MFGFFKSLPLKRQLLYSVSLGFFVLGFSLIYISGENLEEAMLEDVTAKAQNELAIASAQVEEKMDEGFAIARTVAHSFIALRENGKVKISREDAVKILKEQMLANKSILGIGTLWEKDAFDGNDSKYVGSFAHDKTGRFIPYVSRSRSGDLNHEALVDYETPGAGDYYLLARQLHKEVVIEPYIYPVDGVDTLMTTLTVPILVDGSFVGAVSVDLALDFLQSMADSLDIFSKKGKLILLSNQGVVAAFTGKKDSVMKPISEVKEEGYIPIAKERLAANKLSTKLGEFNLSVVAPFAPGRTQFFWYTEVTVPKDVIVAPINMAKAKQVVIGLVIFVSVFALLYLVIRLADTTLNHASTRLKEAAESSEESARQLVTQAQVLASASVENAAATQESVASISEIGAMVALTKERTEESTEYLNQVAETTKQGVELISNLAEAMEKIEDANEKLVGFSRIIQNIEEKTKVINDIVFKTQLLSFNASIESARAGQHGRGFAVVAEEVGNLAELSGNAAKEISQLLAESTKEVLNAVNFSKIAVGEGRDVSSKVTDSFQAISKSMHDVISNMNSIREATQEQVIGLTEVEKAMKALEQTAIDSSTSNEKFNHLAQESNRNSEGIMQVSFQIDKIVSAQAKEKGGAKIKLDRNSNLLSKIQKSNHLDAMDEEDDYSSFNQRVS